MNPIIPVFLFLSLSNPSVGGLGGGLPPSPLSSILGSLGNFSVFRLELLIDQLRSLADTLDSMDKLLALAPSSHPSAPHDSDTPSELPVPSSESSSLFTSDFPASNLLPSDVKLPELLELAKSISGTGGLTQLAQTLGPLLSGMSK